MRGNKEETNINKEVKKRKKGKWKIVVGVIVALGIIGALTNEGEESKDKEVADETSVESAATQNEDEGRNKPDEKDTDEKDKDEKATNKDRSSEDKVDYTVVQKALEDTIVAELKKQFGEDSVIFDEEEKVFSIIPPEQVALELSLMKEGHMERDDWEMLRENMVELSKSIKENLGEGYTLSLLNPMNTDNTLLMVVDGLVVYDLFGEPLFN